MFFSNFLAFESNLLLEHAAENSIVEHTKEHNSGWWKLGFAYAVSSELEHTYVFR